MSPTLLKVRKLIRKVEARQAVLDKALLGARSLLRQAIRHVDPSQASGEPEELDMT